jgi:UDP-N-acetylmuramoyl-L-alanyl-D-glutamate--2,6-diaminopimelate ligase
MYNIKKIIEITKGEPHNITDCSDLEFTNFEINSKAINQETFFIAIQGTTHDGHDYISDAINRNCRLAIISKFQDLPIPYILVSDTRRAYSQLSADYYQTNSLDLKIAGITGTNGKSTLHWLISQLIEAENKQSLCIGTLGIRYGNVNIDTNLTTPDTRSIHQALAESYSVGVRYVAMEVSSHALDQSRVADINFDVGVFTNLTQDHLEYHGDMEKYFEAKRELFTLLSKSPKATLAVINIDDPYGSRIKTYSESLNVRTVTYGQNSEADFQIKNYRQSGSASSFTIRHQNQEIEINSPFIALYNAYNLLAALISASHLLKTELKELISKTSQLRAVPGRLESVGNEKFNIFVDYAHTPDALEKALLALSQNKTGDLWVVFGCGGDRDKTKRPIMGKIAERIADRVVITSDNPRTENPDSIIEDICQGLSNKAKNQSLLIEADRKQAIIKTISMAKTNDTILIAGKGHEDYQIIGREKFHFSDQEIVKEALKSQF